jgi:hypothetical protein
MRNRPSLIAALLAVVLTFAVVDPFRVASGRFDSNPFTEMAAELEKSSTAGVLVLASYDDLYKFPVNNYLRDVLGTRLAYHGEIAVEYGYDEVLAQASLGEESFLRYLNSRNISHLIIPMATAETGVVFHRWSTHGTINLDLSSNAFSLVQKSGGDFPLSLYKVNFVNQSEIAKVSPPYTLEWSGVRTEFYSLLRIIDERYKVNYLRKYEERIDTAWVFDGEQAGMTLVSEENPDQEFVVEMKFVAAYGENAPTQVLKMSMGAQVQAVTLRAGEVNTISFIMRNGQTIQIENVFACREGTSFAPSDNDGRKFCYGLRNVDVKLAN